MKLSRTWLMGLAVLAVGACSDDDPVAVDDPTSTIRYYNALADTSLITVRPVDFVESHTVAANLAFRDSSGTYIRTHPGARSFVAFYGVITNSSAAASPPDLTSIRIAEGGFSLTAGSNYTAWITGFARAGGSPAKEFYVTEDTPPVVTTGWSARALNVAAGQGAVDVYVYATTVPATPTWAALAYKTPSAYVAFTAASTYNVLVCPAGAATTATTCTTRAFGAGTAGATTGSTQDPVPGSNVAGSVFTIAVLPPAVTGSPAFVAAVSTATAPLNTTPICGNTTISTATAAGRTQLAAEQDCRKLGLRFAVDRLPARTGP